MWMKVMIWSLVVAVCGLQTIAAGWIGGVSLFVTFVVIAWLASW